MTGDPGHRTFREMVWLLREFEGRRCLWRVPAAAMACATPALLTLAGAVAAIYIGSDLKLYRVVLGAAISLGLTALAGLMARRRLWWSILADRLWSYEAPNPRGTHEVLIRDQDFIRANHVLRRSRFVPMYGARVGTPPPDATELTTRIGVQEPQAWARSTSDEDRIGLIAAAFDAAGMRARVSGRDVFPDGPVDARGKDDVRSSGAIQRGA